MVRVTSVHRVAEELCFHHYCERALVELEPKSSYLQSFYITTVLL